MLDVPSDLLSPYVTQQIFMEAFVEKASEIMYKDLPCTLRLRF